MSLLTGWVRSSFGAVHIPAIRSLALSLAIPATMLGCREHDGFADLVLTGGAVYTMDSTSPKAEALAVRAGRIVWVGRDVDAQRWAGPSTDVVTLEGQMVLPGFHDTHVHPVSGGIELGECDLNPARSQQDVRRMVAECAERDSVATWIRGGGYQLPFFTNGAPTRQLLDSLVPSRPAYLSSADGHSAWVNTRALEAAGVEASTLDPPEGVILRDRNGEPSGTLRESAMDLVSRVLPARTDDEYLAGLRRGLELAARYGITTLHEASADERTLRAYVEAERNGQLTARCIISLYVDPAGGTAEVARLAALRDRFPASDLVRPVAAKIFVDGVIEGQTAALLEPYTDRPDFRGELNIQPDSLNALIGSLDSAGFKVHLHTIGDRAIRVGLDAFERRYAVDGGNGPRHIMAHIQLFDPADIPRFAALGVVASFQPLWAYSDTYITELTEPRLGPQRSRWLYPIASVMETGAIVAAGSDWSVSSMNPLEAIEVAITRRDPDLDEGPSWLPEQRVSLDAMLRAYTIAGAMAGDLERETGSIEVGKRADLVVLERDLFDLAPERISDVRVTHTYLGGREVYRR